MKSPGKREREGEGRLQPSIDTLKVFVELGDRIRAAAKQGTSYASPSALADAMTGHSKANVFRVLAELREVYGRQLLNRNTVTLTSEGEAVFEWAKALLLNHAKGRKWPIGDREQIRIGTSNWILSFIMPGVVRTFQEERAKQRRRAPTLPEVDLLFGEYDVQQLLVELRRGRVHAGVAAIFAADLWPDLAVQSVRPVATVMIASSENERWGRDARRHRREVELTEVAGEPVAVIEADLHTVLARLPGGGGRIIVQNYASVVAFVRAGVAIGFVPELQKAGSADDGAYQGLDVYPVEREQVTPRTLSILRRAGDELPEEVEAFLRAVSAKLS